MIERRIATLCLYDKDKRVLMQHRATDAPYLPGYWGFFGGLVDGEETPEQTVRRDMFLKTEYRPHRPVLFVKEKRWQGGVRALTYIFIDIYDDVQPIIMHEGQDYGWFIIDDALNLQITPERRKTLLKLQKHLQ